MTKPNITASITGIGVVVKNAMGRPGIEMTKSPNLPEFNAFCSQYEGQQVMVTVAPVIQPQLESTPSWKEIQEQADVKLLGGGA